MAAVILAASVHAHGVYRCFHVHSFMHGPGGTGWAKACWRLRTEPRQRPPATSKTAETVGLFVTGYSWGCGTPNGITANGDIPHVGSVASGTLPFGTRVYVPSLNYWGIVDDRGVAPGRLDLFAPDCAATYAYTGWRQVVISP